MKGFPIVSLEGNSIAVYKAHADALRARFADPTFKAELSGVLERAGWPPERAAAYLKSIEVNLGNFEKNLSPYIEAAAKVAAKRQASTREGIGAGHDDLPGFLKKAAADPTRPEALPAAKKAPPKMSQQRYEEHVAVVQMTSPGDKLYTPIQFRGGGHAWEAPEKAVALVAADLQVKRERYAAELARYKVLEAGDQNSGEFKRLKRMMMGYDGPPAQGTHWSEQAKPLCRSSRRRRYWCC